MAVLGDSLGVNTNHPKEKKPWEDPTGRITENNLPWRTRPMAMVAGLTP